MRCPFLKEVRVKFCRVSPGPKMIARATTSEFEEKCSSPSYAGCAVYRQQPTGSTNTLCPYLEISPAQYCSAVAETRPIPQKLLPSNCETGCYRYCCVYRKTIGKAEEARRIEGISLPLELHYAANHVWLDLAEDGWCHAGIDGFLTKLLGRVENVTTVVPGRQVCPTAVVRAHELDWRVAFPALMPGPAANPHLRAHPEHLITDPYGSGWLFAGQVDVESRASAAGLMSGEQAVKWMQRELGRISRLLRGRAFEEGLLGRLEREEALSLFEDFCQ